MSMAALPSRERPRERLFAVGVAALSERELLALVLRSGSVGVNALALADELLRDDPAVGDGVLRDDLILAPARGLQQREDVGRAGRVLVRSPATTTR